MPTPAPQQKPVEPGKVRARVLSPTYGDHVKGDVIEVTPTEIERTTHRGRDGKIMTRALVSLDDEDRERNVSEKPDQNAKARRAQTDRRKAWSKLDAEAAAMRKESETAPMREMITLLQQGGKPAA